jgi:hypothetical protein
VDLLREVLHRYVIPIWNAAIHGGRRQHLERLDQEQEEQHTMTIDFEFPRGLKNSVTTFQAVIRQPATTNLIDSPARPPIGTPLMTT